MDKCYLAIMDELLKPHLVIYLDQSIDVTKQRIKARNLPGEANSPVYKDESLKALEKRYKEYLQTIGLV